MSNTNGNGEGYRIMVRVRIHPGMEREFEKTWRDVASTISRHPANLGQSLTRDEGEDGVYYIVSDWESEKQFRQFEKSPEHAVNRTRLDPYRDRGHASMTGMTVIARIAPKPTTGRVRVLLNLADAPDSAPVENGYHRISRDLVGRPGLYGNELLRSLHDPRKYTVLSEWADLATWKQWEQSPEHLPTTSPLETYLDDKRGATFGVYEVVAAY
jgi:heme-degrading monooxygenase HmoA